MSKQKLPVKAVRSTLLICTYHRAASGIRQRPADKTKLKPENHATVAAYRILKTESEIVPVTTSKQAIQANTAPAKNKWIDYKQKKIKQKPLQSTKVFKLVLKDLSAVF